MMLGMEAKKCTKCHEVKSVDDFYRRRKKGETVGHQSWCKTCMGKHRTEWSKKNPARVRYHDRKKSLRGRYGKDAAERYELLFERQGGACAICGEPETYVRGGSSNPYRLAMDHDHETGKVRGLLCRGCNQALGKVGDNIEGVRRLLDYLENPPNADLPEFIEVKRWSTHYAACMECETTTVPYGGGGLCRNCYMRKARRDGKPWVKDIPWSERKKRGALSPSKRLKK